MIQTEAAHGPAGAAAEGKRTTRPRSPAGSRGFLQRHVRTASSGQNRSALLHYISFKVYSLPLSVLTPPPPDVAALQEAQRENAFLRAQFAERTDCAALEKAEAERRLGAVEAETRRLTESIKEACERHAEEMKKQEERVCAYLTCLPNASVAIKGTTELQRN